MSEHTALDTLEDQLRLLVSRGDEEVSNWLGDFAPNPPDREGSVAFRSTSNHGSRDFADLPSPVTSVQNSGPYLNIELDPDWLLELVRSEVQSLSTWHPRLDAQWHIEHTSLNPVYPLNLATFRSTCIGECISAVLARCGCATTTRYWVQDQARQVDLVRGRIRRGMTATGKVDHVIGAAFADEVLSRRVEEPARLAALESMFPSIDNPILVGDGSDEYSNREIADLCISGVNETFARVGVAVGKLDFESELMLRYSPEELHRKLQNAHTSSARLIPLLKEDSSLPTYLMRNIAYYNDVLAEAGACISVVPHRQREVLESAKSYALGLLERPDEDIRLLYYGDVRDSAGRVDSVSEGRFTAVDDVLDQLAGDPAHNVMVVDGLKLLLLAAQPTRAVTIPERPEDVVRRPLRWQRAAAPGGVDGTSDLSARRVLLAALGTVDQLQTTALSLNPAGLVRACDRLGKALSHREMAPLAARQVGGEVLTMGWSCLVGGRVIEAG